MSDFSMADPRTAARGAWLFDRIVATGSVVLRELGGTRAGEVAVQRYLSSPYVTADVIIGALGARARLASAGRRVVAAQDTTEINFSGRSAARRGLGRGGDGATPGFFIHPVVVVDADEEAVLGLAAARIWTRAAEKVSDRHGRDCESRESARWLDATRSAAKVLDQSPQVICVADREGDIWSHFAHHPDGIDLAIRARHDRPLEGGGRLFEAFADQPPLIVSEVKVAPREPGDKGRIAKVALRCGAVRITRPASAPRNDPEVLELGLVEAIEQDTAATVTKPLLWRIVTTLPVKGADDAREVVRLYRLRWRIEEVFRALKREGLALEETQVQDATHLFHLSALALGAAVRILQLVDARDGGSRPMSDVLDPELQSAVAVIVRSREGATARQKNPHPQGSLAWLAWTVARFGGWNCYYKPPGPKTMAKGWERFAATLSGMLLATERKLP
jgi:hypothetical protein